MRFDPVLEHLAAIDDPNGDVVTESGRPPGLVVDIPLFDLERENFVHLS